MRPLLFALLLTACAPITPEPAVITTPSAVATNTLPARPAASRIVRADPTATPEPTVSATASVAVNSPEVMAQFVARDEACDDDATSAQQERALDAPRAFFRGRTIALTGSINDVRDLSSGFDAIISLDKISKDILVDLDEELALSLNRNDPVLVEGQLEITGCVFYDKITGTLTPLD